MNGRVIFLLCAAFVLTFALCQANGYGYGNSGYTFVPYYGGYGGGGGGGGGIGNGGFFGLIGLIFIIIILFGSNNTNGNTGTSDVTVANLG